MVQSKKEFGGSCQTIGDLDDTGRRKRVRQGNDPCRWLGRDGDRGTQVQNGYKVSD